LPGVGGLFKKGKVRYNVVLVLFCGFFIFSIVTLVANTANYLEFYSSLKNLYLRIDSFNYDILELGGKTVVCVNGRFSLVHNSSYRGLVLESVYVSMFVEGEVEPFFEHRFWANDIELAPYSTVSFDVENLNLTENVDGFVNCKREFGSVNVLVRSAVFIYVFGGPFATKVELEDFYITL
jgi:hypothetical protein